MYLFSERKLDPELRFSTSRSSGPGGQNVNKVNSRVELRFDIALSSILSDEEKSILLEKLKTRITISGELCLVSQTERSQLKNKEKVVIRFYNLIEKSLRKRKKRIATKPPVDVTERRLDDKKIHSRKKEDRKPPEF